MPPFLLDICHHIRKWRFMFGTACGFTDTHIILFCWSTEIIDLHNLITFSFSQENWLNYIFACSYLGLFILIKEIPINYESSSPHHHSIWVMDLKLPLRLLENAKYVHTFIVHSKSFQMSSTKSNYPDRTKLEPQYID